MGLTDFQRIHTLAKSFRLHRGVFQHSLAEPKTPGPPLGQYNEAQRLGSTRLRMLTGLDNIVKHDFARTKLSCSHTHVNTEQRPNCLSIRAGRTRRQGPELRNASQQVGKVCSSRAVDDQTPRSAGGVARSKTGGGQQSSFAGRQSNMRRSNIHFSC